MQSDNAIILDMDGVLLQTHHLRALAWKETLDNFLNERSKTLGEDQAPIDLLKEYRDLFDGKPCMEGLKEFLNSRDISLPLGSPNDPTGFGGIYALGNAKEEIYLDLLESKGPQVYQDSLDCVKRWTNQHVPLAVVSSSLLCRHVLKIGNIEIFFDAIIDPQLASKQRLKGKPEPDYFLHGAELLGYKPEKCLVVEDSQAGVQAAKKGGFPLVYGIVHDRDQRKAQELKEAGADKVIFSLTEVEGLHFS